MIYLLAKLVTERNSYAISMLKILGYTNREAARLYNRATGIGDAPCLAYIVAVRQENW